MRGQKRGDEVTGQMRNPGKGYRTERQERLKLGFG